MPLTPQEKKNVLVNAGLDPAKYDYDEDSQSAVERVQAQPSINASSVLSKPNYSKLQTVGVHAAGSIAPSAAGLVGAVGGAKVGGALGLPLGPIGAGVGAVAGGIAGGVGLGSLMGEAQNWILNKVSPKSVEILNESAQENPYSATVGSLLGSLPSVRPDWKAVEGAGRFIREASRSNLKNALKSPENAANFGNVVVGGGVGGGLALKDQLDNPEGIDWGQVALQTAGQSILNNPAKWSTKLPGIFKASRNTYDTSGEVIDRANLDRTERYTPKTYQSDTTEGITGKPSSPPESPTEFAARTGLDPEKYYQAETPNEVKASGLEGVDPEPKIDPASTTPPLRTSAKVVRERLDAYDRSLSAAVGGEDINPNDMVLLDEIEFKTVERAIRARALGEEAANAHNNRPTKVAEPVSDNSALPSETPLQTEGVVEIPDKRTVAPKVKFSSLKPEPLPNDPVESSPLADPLPTTGQSVIPEPHNIPRPPEPGLRSPVTVEEPAPKQPYAGTAGLPISKKSGLPELLTAELESQGRQVGSGLTPKNEAFQAALGAKHGVDLSRDDSLSSAGKITGFTDKVNKLNAKLGKGATLDTGDHEIIHAVLRNLSKSDNPADIRQVKSFIEAVRKSPELAKFMADNGYKMPTTDEVLARFKSGETTLDNIGQLEEFLVNRSGHANISRALSKPGLRRDMRDMVLGIKRRLGRLNANEAAEQLSGRSLYDAPKKFDDDGVLVGPKSVGLNQPDQQLDLPLDEDTGFKYLVKTSKDGKSENVQKYPTKQAETELKRMNKIAESLKSGSKYSLKDASKDEGLNQPDQGLFTTRAQTEMDKPAPFNIRPNSKGQVDRMQLLNKMQSTPGEYAAWKEAGIEEFVRGKTHVDVEELRTWMDENGPKLEVTKHEAGNEIKNRDVADEKAHKLQFRRSEISHELDTLGYSKDGYDTWKTPDGRRIPERELPPQVTKLNREYDQLGKSLEQLAVTQTPKSASARFPFVNTGPIGPNDVDILVKVPYNKPTSEGIAKGESASPENIARLNRSIGVKFTEDSHFPDDPNVVSFARVRFEKGPNGEKIAHVIEVQSDWASMRRSVDERLVKGEDGKYTIKPAEGYRDSGEVPVKYNTKEEADAAYKEQYGTWRHTPNDPALKYYNELAVKGAIDHAIKEGATHIAVSDSETVMLSEGHDKIRSAVKPYPVEDFGGRPQTKRYGNDWQEGKYVSFKDTVYRIDKPESNSSSDIPIAKELVPYSEGGNYIPQEKGMRLNYDQTLPSILSKLTEHPGERMSFGEHQNILGPKITVNGEEPPAHRTGLRRNVREDLILKNPDGSLKTDATARVYPLDKVVEKLNLSGGKFNMYTKGGLMQPNQDLGFHVPTVDFTEFQPKNEKAISNARSMFGHFFTTEEPKKGNIAGGLYDKIKTVDTSNLRLFDWDAYGNGSWERFSATPLDKNFQRALTSVKEVKDNLIKKGYDGIIVHEIGQGTTKVVFDESKNKLISVNNSLQQPLSDFGKAAFDKVESLGGHAKEVAQAFRDFELDNSILQGQFSNKIKNDLRPYAKDDIKSAYDRMDKIFRAGSGASYTPTDPIEKILSSHFTNVANEQIRRGLTIGGRTRGKDPSYVPHILSDKALDVFSDRPNSAEADALKKLWVDYLKIKDPSLDGEKFVDTYLRGLTGDEIGSAEFGALRKAEGLGLPDELKETDIYKILTKYGNRAAKDLAFYTNLQSKPEIAAALNFRDVDGNASPITPAMKAKGVRSIITDPVVQQAKQFINNEFGKNQPGVRSVARLVSNGILGIGTGLRDASSVPVNALPYMKSIGDLGSFYDALSHFGENWKKALEYNSRSTSLDDLTFGTSTSVSPLINGVNKLSHLVRQASGRDLIEQSIRTYVHGMGESLARLNFLKAMSGDANGEKFLRKFGGAVDVDGILKSKKITADDYSKIAKSFVDRNQGSYGGRGLPAKAIEGDFAPFLALSRWGIEKMNVIREDVLKPARQGDLMPLLFYTLGAFMTGSAIRELNEYLTNKRSYDPSLKETLDSGKDTDVIAEIVNLMQLGSFVGIASDIAKAGSDITLKGQTPRGLGFPLADTIANVTKNVAHAKSAIDSGEDPAKVILALGHEVAKTSIQNYRYISSHSNKEDTDHSNKIRDLRVWQDLTDRREPSDPIASNPLMNIEGREFKHEKDVGKAAKMLPDLITKAMKKATDEDGLDVEMLRKELVKLKQNSYQTMPSPETLPSSFLSYLKYLQRTQGPEEAQKRLIDFMTTREVNKVKSSLVPRL